jgi:transcriptional regulator with XRE-family HTH domain
MSISQDAVSDLLDIEDMTQVELAAALNTTQAAVSQWVSGVRTPNESARTAIERASDARAAKAHVIDAGLRRGPVSIPTKLWEPAFTPKGRFRLPLRLEWSGTGQQRWRDARDIDSLLTAYVQVMVEGTVADIVTWVDPKVLANNFSRVLWPRRYEALWRGALEGWGLL